VINTSVGSIITIQDQTRATFAGNIQNQSFVSVASRGKVHQLFRVSALFQIILS